MTRKILTDKQIEEGKQLRILDPKKWTKEALSNKYQVSPTTIFDHIFGNGTKNKTYVKTRSCCYFCDMPIEKHPRCKVCTRLIHESSKEAYVCGCGLDHSYGLAGHCAECYAKKHDIEYPSTAHKHTHEELGRIFGMSVERVAGLENKIHQKIVHNVKTKDALEDTTYHKTYTKNKFKSIKNLLKDIPEHLAFEREEVLKRLEDWEKQI